MVREVLRHWTPHRVFGRNAGRGRHPCEEARSDSRPLTTQRPWETGTLAVMKLDTTVLLPVTAVVASVLLLLAGRKRILEIIAVAASGAWLAMALDIFSWPLKGKYLSA